MVVSHALICISMTTKCVEYFFCRLLGLCITFLCEVSVRILYLHFNWTVGLSIIEL